MKCLMDKSREVSYPCSHACPLFGDCVVEFETERSAGGMGGRGSFRTPGKTVYPGIISVKFPLKKQMHCLIL